MHGCRLSSDKVVLASGLDQSPQSQQSSQVPQHCQYNLDDQHRSNLSTVVRSEGVERTPRAGDRRLGIEQPEKGQKPSSSQTSIPQEQVDMVNVETVNKLGQHSDHSHHRHKTVGRRGRLARRGLILDKVAHKTNLHSGKEELNQTEGQNGQISGRQRLELHFFQWLSFVRV